MVYGCRRQANGKYPLSIGHLNTISPGFVLVGVAALGLSSFMLFWGLAP